MKNRTIESVVIGNDALDAEGAELPGWVLVERVSGDPEKTRVLAVSLSKPLLQAVPTVNVVQVRTADLGHPMVVRRHGTTEPWRSVDAVVSGDGGRGVEDVIAAGGGDLNDAQNWPFERIEHHAFPQATQDRRINDNQFHWDDVAVIFSVPDRDFGAPDGRDSELVISDRYTLWDVQVITHASLAFTDGELQTLTEAVA